MAANSQTIKIIEVMLSGDAGLTEEERNTVLAVLRGRKAPVSVSDSLLTEKDVQTMLKCSHQTVWRKEKDGTLKSMFLRDGGKRYSLRQIQQYIESELNKTNQD